MKKLFFILIFIVGSFILNGQDYNCFSVIAGKNTTVDGSVLLAHNEDDPGEQMLNIYITKSESDKDIAKYIWAEFPGMATADAFMNEHGVAIASDNCPSREKSPELTNGGVLYEMRVTVAKHAKSARHAVQLLSELVEKYGYNASGRSYLVADANEGWIFSVVNGKHWAAARVPDDKVLIIPNYYVIDKIDFADTANYLACEDLVSYAQSRGWYKPERDGEFSFRKAYGRPNTLVSNRNVYRHLSAIQYITGKEYAPSLDNFEFLVSPKKKLDIQDMINILRSHGEYTPYQDSIKTASENHHPGCICVNTTVSAAVFQLRSNLPAEIASVMWLAPYRPCASAFTPWYIGMTKAPEGYGRFASYKEAEEKHFSDAQDKRKNYPDHYYWKVIDRFEEIDQDYHNRIVPVAKKNDKIQKRLFSNQKKFEKSVVKSLKKGKDVRQMLNNYCQDALK